MARGSSPFVAALDGLGLAAAAFWFAWQAFEDGELVLTRRMGGFHLDAAGNPLGFWLGEAALVAVGALFLLGAVLSLRRSTPPSGR